MSIRSSRRHRWFHLWSFLGCCIKYCTNASFFPFLGGCLRLSSFLPKRSSPLLRDLHLEQAKPEHSSLLLGLFLQRALYSVRVDSLFAVGWLSDHRAFNRHWHGSSVLLFQPSKREDEEFKAVYNASFLVSEGWDVWWVGEDCCRFQNRSCVRRRKILHLEESGKEGDIN